MPDPGDTDCFWCGALLVTVEPDRLVCQSCAASFDRSAYLATVNDQHSSSVSAGYP